MEGIFLRVVKSKATFLSNVCRHDKATKRKIFTTNDNSRVFKIENILVMGPELQHQSWQFWKDWKEDKESTDAWWKYWMLIHWSRNTSLPRNKPIYVISEFSKKKVWSKQDSVRRRQHHIKRFFASWPCRTLVQQKFTKLSTLKARGQRRRRTQCLKITQKMSQFYKIHIFEKFAFLKSSHFWKIQIFIKFTCVVCTKFAPNNIFFSNHSKFLACEKKMRLFFCDFQTLCKGGGGDDGNFPRVASPKCLQKRFGSVWISAAFSHAWGQYIQQHLCPCLL